MPDDCSSLLDQPAQALLPIDDVDGLPPAPAQTVEDCARIPVFTGARFFERFPERYRLFCALFFSSGLGQMEACRLLRMSPQTGASIIARELASMGAEQLRQYQVRQARAVVSGSLSAMLESLSDPARVAQMSQRDHAQAAKVAHEIASLLDGQPTARTERVGDSDTNQRAADLLRQLGVTAKPITAREIAEPREAAAELVAADLGAAPGAELAPADPSAGVSSDLQSRVREAETRELLGCLRGGKAGYTGSDTPEAGGGQV
jgi:hypothetical protein